MKIMGRIFMENQLSRDLAIYLYIRPLATMGDIWWWIFSALLFQHVICRAIYSVMNIIY